VASYLYVYRLWSDIVFSFCYSVPVKFCSANSGGWRYASGGKSTGNIRIVSFEMMERRVSRKDAPRTGKRPCLPTGREDKQGQERTRRKTKILVKNERQVIIQINHCFKREEIVNIKQSKC